METTSTSPAVISDLIALARSFQEACEERLSILRDEWTAAQYGGYGVIDDIDDQICHWQALHDRCNEVIRATL